MTLPEVWEVLRRFCVGTETRRLIFRSIVFSFAIRVAILLAAYSAGYDILNLEGLPLREVLRQTLDRWDAFNYKLIAEHGYPTSGDRQELIVFLPLFPYLVRAVEFVIPSFLVAGMLISAVASVAAGYFCKRSFVSMEGTKRRPAARSGTSSCSPRRTSW